MVVHLNIHTSYDLLHSTIRIDSLVTYLKQLGHSSVAITDLNVLFGVQSFYSACRKAGIKPILGMEVIVTDGIADCYTVLLAKNNAGFKRLMQLSSRIQLKGLNKITVEILAQYSDDLVIIYKSLDMNQTHFLLLDKDIYVSHDSTVDAPTVYIDDVRYLTPEGIVDLDILNAIDENKKLPLETVQLKSGTKYIKTDEMLCDIGVSQAAIDATHEIAEKCQVELEKSSHLPKFKVPEHETSDSYLKRLLNQEKMKLPQFDERYDARLKYEYDVICKMGFSDYFLIVSDLIHFAKSNQILVGPGRGSSSGSLVSYVLNITTVDPIAHDLLFERFLNPERVTMPDIDIDFEDTRRDEVIDYVIKKYGAYNVSGIVTFGHLSMRAAMRDVGRILQFSESELKEASALLGKGFKNLQEAYEDDDFARFVDNNQRRKKWYQIACSLEDLPRNTSTHAAGIIIHDQLLTDYVPLIMGEDMPLTQWNMTEVEAVGLLKIDFLGLRNLTIIQNILRSIHKQYGTWLNIEHLPMDDKKVFQALSSGDTMGIFQLESDGIRQVLKRLKPEHFNDIVAVLSLYRPGPMEQIPVYIERRHQKEKVQFIHDDLREILMSTYGVIIYQEQIMQIANKFAGFSYGEADILRRAMSKKDEQVLMAEQTHFLQGSMKNGYSEDSALRIYDLIKKFANYGFNKAHAVAYAKISYIMMYFKVHYPNIFYAATLSNQIGVENKTREIISEIKMRMIKLYPADINQAGWYYKAQKDGIMMSLGMIKGVGYKSVIEIVNERKNGPYKDIYDFCARIPKRVKSKALLEALIHVGAFDNFKENRATLLASLDAILDVEKEAFGEVNFLESLGLNKKKTYHYHEEMSDDIKANYEMEYLGFYISRHPVESLFKKLQYLPLYRISEKANHQYILIWIEDIRRIRTKKGQPMAFVKGMDGIHHIDLVLFPVVFHQYETILKTNEPIIIKGKFDNKRTQQIIVNEVIKIEAFIRIMHQSVTKLYIRSAIDDSITLNDTGPIEVIDFSRNHTQSVGYISRHQIDKVIECHGADDFRLI
ncbi:DNA polymerase III subunit alpha [Macrococcoides caseolyticum]|uniref:DNA polymerase III subunit alpha n=1 Tax=Macrococcoides caseolyticum TaxID=69966 RepID=UPI001F379932|nr:DNA polymerase III subunit alpha [Macrococcus caseolyticus]MCE4956325.1 DNA polymerase III subunit alpha [Macrococcus caseolyticus]